MKRKPFFKPRIEEAEQPTKEEVVVTPKVPLVSDKEISFCVTKIWDTKRGDTIDVKKEDPGTIVGQLHYLRTTYKSAFVHIKAKTEEQALEIAKRVFKNK